MADLPEIVMPSAPAAPKNHHFVPQMYLRVFADPASKQGELWRYGPGFKPQLKAPKGIAWEDYFYDVAGELPPEDNDMEAFYGETETIAALHLEKLRAGNIKLTPQEKSELATFISLMRTRTRSYREQVNTIASKMHVLAAKEMLETNGAIEDLIEKNIRLGGERLEVEQVRSAMQAVVDGKVIVEQKSKAWTIKQALESSDQLDALIESMNWNLFEAPNGLAFITSDNPVVINDPLGRARGPNGYRPTKMTQLHFPVSAKYLLIGDSLGPNETVQKASADHVAKYNYNQIVSAHREVYAPFNSDALQAEVDRVFREKPALVPELPADLLKK
jgi:hypothetical protein